MTNDEMCATIDRAIAELAAKDATIADLTARLEAAEEEIRGLRLISVNWEHSCKGQASRAQALDAKVARLEGALIPFAEAAAELDNNEPDTREIWEHPCATLITFGDLRIARAALEDQP